MSDLIAHFNYVKRSSPADYVAQTLLSKELFSVLQTRQKAFWWKPGRYSITLKLGALKKFKLTHSQFEFKLTSVDVDRLKQNIAALDSELRECNLVEST